MNYGLYSDIVSGYIISALLLYLYTILLGFIYFISTLSLLDFPCYF